ncbi:hypothetical protein LOK49_LG11G00816 [Camellia lanceoleosa]|uniref:Uncharacterized protein n=1 Tax=Camellia lanceoleosa TaxID=1840588 RepID=A0ACC0G5M7_9ERIC|nr:hypothetical protein LOK49_LG11G00816 [Camellia lanceoleosa]
MSMERSLQITTTGGDGVVGGGGGGLLVKKKGRPRKYESDGNLRLPSISSPTPGFSFSPPFPPPSSESSSSKRGCGRPLDSGRKRLNGSLKEILMRMWKEFENLMYGVESLSCLWHAIFSTAVLREEVAVHLMNLDSVLD